MKKYLIVFLICVISLSCIAIPKKSIILQNFEIGLIDQKTPQYVTAISYSYDAKLNLIFYNEKGKKFLTIPNDKIIYIKRLN